MISPEKDSEGLEDVVEDKSKLSKVADIVKREARAYFTDTTAALIFYNPVFAASEYFVGGMEPEEVISTRLGMSLANLLISRPYGKFREIWANWLKTGPESSKKMKFVTDVSANIVYYAPIYLGIALKSGVSLKEAGLALAGNTALALFIGRPYGWWLDKWRKTWGVKPTLEAYVDKEEQGNLAKPEEPKPL